MKATIDAVLKSAQGRIWAAERKYAYLWELERHYEAAARECRLAADRASQAATAARRDLNEARDALSLLATAELEPESESVNQSAPSGGAL